MLTYPQESAPGPPFVEPQFPATVPASGVITGVLVKVEGNFFVINNDEGKEIRLLISKDTELAGAFKPGDRIEVQTSPVEHAMNIAVVMPHAEPPGIPSQTVRGELVKIEGHHYVMKDMSGKEVRLHVSDDTKIPDDLKRGDLIEVQIAPLEHAMFIRATK